MYYTVKYYAGTYEGTKRVSADDEEDAICKVRAWVRRTMSLSMYADGYKIVDSDQEEDD